MAWSGGTYTKGNNATGGWTGDAAAGIGIEAGRHDTQDNDFATGINQCLNKDGSNAATGNLNIGSFKLTAVANGTASTDATNFGQVEAGINKQSTTLSITNTRFSADATGPVFALQKSRGASVGTNTIVQSGDTVGALNFNGANGTTYSNAAQISAVVDGTPGATNDMPGALTFSTTPDGSGTLSERMRIKNDGKIGIGESSPTAQLQVTSGSASTKGFVIKGAASASTNLMEIQNSSGTSLVVVDQTGKVGIGQAASGAFDVSSISASCYINQFSNDVNPPQIIFQKSRNATIGSNTIVQSGDGLGTLIFQGANGTTYTGGAQIRCYVDGTPGSSNDMPSRLEFLTTPDGSGTATERVRIDSNGRLFLNTTTVRNNGMQSTDFNGSSAAGLGINDTASANGSGFISFLTGGTFRASITNNNNTAVAYNTTSDYRLKKNVKPMIDGLQKVLALKPSVWTWTENNTAGEGFVAHELAEVIPSAVTGTKDAVDANGNPNYQGVDTSFVVATLAAAIQELNAKLEALQAQVDAL